MGVTADSAVTPIVIVALSLIMRPCFESLQEEEEGHEWPKFKIISAFKAENNTTFTLQKWANRAEPNRADPAHHCFTTVVGIKE